MKANCKEVSLGDAVELVIDYRGKTPKKLGGDWSDVGHRALSAKNIKDGRIANLDSIRFVDDVLYNKWMKEEIRSGDLLLTSEAPLGECYFWNSDEKIVLSQRLFAIRVKQEILDPRFFYIYARSRIFQGELHGRASGSTVQGIRQSELLKTKVILPPLAEQRFIADLLFSLDDKIDVLRTQNKTLEEMAQRLFKEWFVDFNFPATDGKPYKISCGKMVGSDMGDIPEGWSVDKLGSIVDVKGGTTPSTKEQSFWNGEHFWTSPKDLSRCKDIFLRSTEKTITHDGLSQISSGLLPVGTVLLSSRAPIGYMAITDVPVAINQGYIAMTPREDYGNYFMYLWVKNHLGSIITAANGSTFLEISKSSFKNINIARPSEQIVLEFKKVIKPIFEKISNNEKQNAQLSMLRDILLPLLLNGEFEVK